MIHVYILPSQSQLNDIETCVDYFRFLGRWSKVNPGPRSESSGANQNRCLSLYYGPLET